MPVPGGRAARVPDEDVEAAEGLDRLGDGALEILRQRHVAADGERAEAVRLALEHVARAREHRHVRAFGGEGLGARKAEARGGAADEGRAAFQSEIHAGREYLRSSGGSRPGSDHLAGDPARVLAAEQQRGAKVVRLTQRPTACALGSISARPQPVSVGPGLMQFTVMPRRRALAERSASRSRALLGDCIGDLAVIARGAHRGEQHDAPRRPRTARRTLSREERRAYVLVQEASRCSAVSSSSRPSPLRA